MGENPLTIRKHKPLHKQLPFFSGRQSPRAACPNYLDVLNFVLHTGLSPTLPLLLSSWKLPHSGLEVSMRGGQTVYNRLNILFRNIIRC